MLVLMIANIISISRRRRSSTVIGWMLMMPRLMLEGLQFQRVPAFHHPSPAVVQLATETETSTSSKNSGRILLLLSLLLVVVVVLHGAMFCLALTSRALRLPTALRLALQQIWLAKRFKQAASIVALCFDKMLTPCLIAAAFERCPESHGTYIGLILVTLSVETRFGYKFHVSESEFVPLASLLSQKRESSFFLGYST